MERWASAALWSWTLTSTTIAVTAGTDTVELPYDFRDIYGARLLTAKRPLIVTNRRIKNRYKWDHTLRSEPIAVDLFDRGSGGMLRLTEIPATNDTIHLDYYRYTQIPCLLSLATADWTSSTTNIFDSSVSGGGFAGVKLGARIFGATTSPLPYAAALIKSVTDASTVVTVGTLSNSAAGVAITVGSDNDFLDIPTMYESAVLDMATAHLLMSVGGPIEKAQGFEANGAAQLAAAVRENNTTADLDLAFMPMTVVDAAYWNPNAVD